MTSDSVHLLFQNHSAETLSRRSKDEKVKERLREFVILVPT